MWVGFMSIGNPIIATMVVLWGVNRAMYYYLALFL